MVFTIQVDIKKLNLDEMKKEIEDRFTNMEALLVGTNYIMKQNSILDPSQGIAPNPGHQ